VKGITRYEWEDVLIESQALFMIKKQPVCSALLLSRQINWSPKNGGRPSLRWKNVLAAETVGIPRSTLMQHLKVLKSADFLSTENGNLIPTVPSHYEEIRQAFKEMVVRLSEANSRKEKTSRRDVLPDFSTNLV